MKHITLFVIAIVFIAHGQLKLSGNQEGVFDSSDYVVSQDIIVKEGTKLEFISGCDIRFEPYIGIKVFGDLILTNCELSAKENNWNGINVAQKGSVKFKNVTISNSVFGIALPDSAAIKELKDVVFTDNKKSLQIGSQNIIVTEGKPFSISTLESSNIKTEHNKDLLKLDGPISKRNNTVLAVRWISLISTIACTGVSLYCAGKSDHYVSKYNELGEDDLDQFQNVRKSITKYNNYTLAAGIGAGVSAVVFSCTFAF